MNLSHEQLLATLFYDPDTGLFTRRVRLAANAPAGGVAGCFKHAKVYVIIKLFGVSYAAHRLAWFYMTGCWPSDQIDHVDTNKKNNRWANLREASAIQNGYNKGLTINNRSGYKGVSRTRKGFVALIKVSKKPIRLGVFSSASEAGLAYARAAAMYHGEFARVGSVETSDQRPRGALALVTA